MKTLAKFAWLLCLTIPTWSQSLCGLSGDTTIHQPASYDSFAAPALGATYTDSVFGCKITRLTDAINNPGSQTCTNATCQGRHFYSTVAPDNLDNSIVMVTLAGLPALIAGPSGTYGTPGTILVKQSAFPTSNLTSQGFVWWDISNPLVFYYTATNNFIKGVVTGLPGCAATNSCTVTSTTLATASGYTAIALMDDEDISEDGMHGYLGAHSGSAINDAGCSTSAQTCGILPVTLSATGGSGTATIGTAILTAMYWHKIQIALNNRFNIEAPNGVNTFTEYNTDGTTYKTLLITHHDFIHNPSNNNESVIGAWSTGTAANDCTHENGLGQTDTATTTMLNCLIEVALPATSNFGIPPGQNPASHVSSRDVSLGWVIFEAESYQSGACPNATNPYCEPATPPTSMTNWGLYDGEIDAMKADGSQFLRLAHHRSRSGAGYWAGPRATISKNAKYVYFDSNFDSCPTAGGCNSQTTTSDPQYTDVYAIQFQTPNTASFAPFFAGNYILDGNGGVE